MALARNNKRINARLQTGKAVHSRLERQKARRGSATGAVYNAMQRALMPLIKLVLVFCLTGFILLSGYVGLAHSSLFSLRQVQIDGASHLSRLDILSAAGLGLHTNLISLQPEQAEEGIRELPWIIQVNVQRSLPGKIEISVQEETPYAIGLIEGELFYLNKLLKPFAPFAYDAQLDLPVISGLSRADMLREDDELEEVLAEGMELLSLLDQVEEPLWGRLSQLNLSPHEDMKLVFENMPATVKFGRQASQQKIEQLRQLSQDLAKRDELKRAVLIDLSIKERIIVRLGQNSL